MSLLLPLATFLLAIHLHAAQSPISEFDDSDGPLKKGIIFHEDRKILMAEKFINVQFLLPFPQFSVSLKSDLARILTALHSMWDMPTYNCYLNFTNTSTKGFDINWLMAEVQKEVNASDSSLAQLHAEVARFLSLPPPSPPSSRVPRALPLAAVAVGAIGLFGTGVSMGSGSCGLSGIFGTCQSEENADAINRMFAMTSSISDNIQHLATESNNKFFVIGKELQAIRELQQQMAEIQNDNWRVITQQMASFRDDIHVMRNCDQFLFTRQQINFNFDTIASLLSLFYSNVKSYRAALFAYRLNLLNSIPALLNQYIPMSLLDRASLDEVISVVQSLQNKALDRLTLAIPPHEALSYYEARLLQDVVALPEGLLLTMSIPLASRQTVMTLYEAIPIPMPQDDAEDAMIWDLEADFLAVSEDGRETALVSRTDLTRCIGSTRYSICHHGLATEGLWSSCLSLLFFGNLVQAMKFCDFRPYALPVSERALNLKFGIWLILSASPDFELRESDLNDTTHLSTKVYPGCRICILTLACGRQIRGPNVYIRSDLQTCSQMPSIKIHVDLPAPLANILSTLPPLDKLPSYNTKSSANLDLLRTMKQEIKYLPSTSAQSPEALRALAEPIAMQMVELKQPIQARLAQTSTLKMTILLGLGSFIISMLLHLLFMYLFHRYHSLHKFMPFTHLLNDTENKQTHKITLQPTFHVPAEHITCLQDDESFAWRDRCFLAPQPNPPPPPSRHAERHF